MGSKTFMAFDFGAESARGVVGLLKDKVLELQEIHRFPTRMISMNNHYYWNVYRFYEEIVHALTLAVNEHNLYPESIAVDSWGVDHGFLAADDTLVRIPYAYRDPQTVDGMKDFHAHVMAPEEIYALTGISMQAFNSLYHLHALNRNNDLAKQYGRRLLFMPDLINFFLCGEKKTEFTFATTSQLYNPNLSDWDEVLLASVGLDKSYMNEIIQPGETIGTLHEWISKQTGLHHTKVVSVGSHDTASAILAVPVQSDNWAYISSGTWSLMGIETTSPIITEKSFQYNFSNEGGVGGTYRLLKNIMGLWLLQQCQRSWAIAGENYTYSELVEMAVAAKPFTVFIDPDYPEFYHPEDMPSAIGDFCRKTGQPTPQSKGEYVRCILESLALKYRMVLGQIQEVSGKNPDTIHIIGGGTKNELLCQFTADATGKPVVTGPAEGTAVGNILMQAKACGYLNSITEIREVVVNTFEVSRYYPKNTDDWQKAFDRFRGLSRVS
jgi:rhamnulokinase